MTAAFGTLGDDHVRAGFCGPFCLVHAAGHEHHLATRCVGAREGRGQILPALRPGERHHRRRSLQRGGKACFIVHKHQEVDGEGPISRRA